MPDQMQLVEPQEKYKWDSPVEWLHHHIDKYAEASDGRLTQLAKQLASELDCDQIQDLFQDEMDGDGYFKDLAKEERIAQKISNLTREQCVKILEGEGFECYDHEDAGILQTAIQENFDDGTLKEQDLDV